MAHLLAVFLVSFTFYQTIHSLPILSGSGAIPENGIDCSQAPSSKVDLSEIESGLFVIEKYIHLQYPQIVPFNYVCDNKSPVPYKKYSTEHLPTSSVNSSQYLANWYAVITAFIQHLSNVETTITDETEMTRLTTTKTLLTGLQQSYLTVLQDLLCNCSESCQIPTIQPAVPFSCSAPASHAQFILGQYIIKYSRSTLNAYTQNCNCQSTSNSTTALQWFHDVFPSDDPHYNETQKHVTP